MKKPDNPLEELGEKYLPSKRLHDYLKHYWCHFLDLRNSVRCLVEIGVQDGHSLYMWRDFFPSATIHGIDFDPACRHHEGDRIRIHIGDQSDPEFLAALQNGGAIDCAPNIIIDDGSHVADHQILTFETWFPWVKPGGCYVIEDIGVHTGRSRKMTFGRLIPLIHNINYWPKDFPGERWVELTSFPEEASEWDRSTVGLAIYRYIAFVFKGRNPQDNRYLTARHGPDDPASGG